jgi:hypothetical protein
MTKTQQKLTRQVTIFLNSGGKAVTAVLRLLLLAVAVLFEAVSIFFSRIEEVLASNLSETEAANKHHEAHAFTLAAEADERKVVSRPNNFNPEPALLTGTTGGLARHK